MVVARLRRLWRERVGPFFAAVLAALAAFWEEATFRASLACAVLAGRLPLRRERRWWNRATEPPVLIDAHDWTDERLLFSILVWPSLETAGRYDQDERAREVKEAFGRVCADRAWSTYFETDHGLRWDAKREVWVGSDGYAFDGARFFAYARAGKG